MDRREVLSMICPGCGTELERLNIRDIELDQCRACRGVWLDHQEIDRLFAIPKIPERFVNMERYREPPPLIPEGRRSCPRCPETLKLISVDGISLDACSGCKGVFCDFGELRLLAEAAERRFAAEQRQKE